MKDKLVKTGHKKTYYFLKRLFIGISATVAASILIALPLSYGVNKVQENEVIVEKQNLQEEITKSID